ncbi:hypothetical protein JDV02_006989 [Purpureocillium takamizusanense]|uniref:Uncharacterized protein n=1 Tax=Purpureocillium takamizusanense TaxID=2060973 RepID=A0A9Q8QM01_9HYPO|nr:uncharacterized protein JDV02_006989 [Purpureocillium takamizusanense]UNI20947.1 hypothetical protein JDV02_006989 [Purpureocillium takamizusanense]
MVYINATLIFGRTFTTLSRASSLETQAPSSQTNAMADGYSTRGLPPAPDVSMRTIPMAGLLVDVYGLDELPADMSTPVTCLWLLHPRTRTRARMADIAKRAVHAWKSRRQPPEEALSPAVARSGSTSSSSSRPTARGLIALAFDMPNHGSRLVSEEANAAWAEGNAQHAVDMAGAVRGAAGDVSALMDLVGAYVGRPAVDAHVALGWSLGGHAAWQAVVGEERLDAAVVIIGCPDLLGLLTDRAAKANLDTGGEPLVGSKYLPPPLTESLSRHDPRGIFFGSAPSPPPPGPTSLSHAATAAAERERLRALLDRHLRGKKLLLCSGGADELVPHARTAPFAAWLADAARGWYADGGLEVQDRVYDGVGHHFSGGMVVDAVEFLVRVVAEGPRTKAARARM